MSFLMWIRQIVMNERKLLSRQSDPTLTGTKWQSDPEWNAFIFLWKCRGKGFCISRWSCRAGVVSCDWQEAPLLLALLSRLQFHFKRRALHSMKTVPYYYNFIPPTPLFYSYIWFRMYNMYNCINLYVYTGPGATQVERDKSAFLRRGSSQWRANTCLLVQMCGLCTCRLQECILFPKF